LKIRTGHSGIHMFNRTTGLNILLDEILVPSTLWDRAPRHVSIALTNLCDLHCAHCFAPKSSDALDFNQVKDWLGELDINGCLAVGFGGGEPTLYPRLVELCRFATQHTRLAVTLTTHALNLDNQLLADLSGNVHFVRVSMDGVGATYEALRGYPFSMFLDCLDTVRYIAPFGINFIVNNHTLQYIDAAVKLAADVGAAEFLLLPEQPVRGFGGIDEITTEGLRQWVSIYKGPVPLTVSEAGADGLPTCNPHPSETGLLALHTLMRQAA
jgi:MoaA/NifB/PqqE/SkfB family radical SAM enzyme